ncbi:hypothetical protein MARA_01560 (plasmid) [Mycolicibacterium arabiense]|uniref:PE family protein n=1 Tax=Mycolicibacterium arabiense TaxID=1286181 RepID=A0A7I7RRP8_9MYCO|nr:type VII secretion target [Mycolicibacterium arabiense]BBY46726.1 hypothetical protein MARA_01560 [Mycolicibacterium arabiense]
MLSVVPAGLDAFAAANQAAAEQISSASSADAAAMLGAVAAAVGPIGAPYLVAYAPAQTNNLASGLMVAGAHAAIGEQTVASRASFVALDDA